VSAASYVDEQKFDRKWLRLFTHYMFHPYRGIQLVLTESNGFNSVLIVVDHLTRMAHFLPCTEIVTAEENATWFLMGVYRLHGLPRVLVSDRDPKFVIGFSQTTMATPWNAPEHVFQSTSRDKRTDGASEH
jgi:hypothetical protein